MTLNPSQIQLRKKNQMPKAVTFLAQVEVRIPVVPNYLVTTGSLSERTIDIANFAVSDLRQLGALWTIELIEHALRRRKEPDQQSR